MFTTLMESRAPRTRRVGSTMVSLLLHGLMIAGAVALTMAGPASAGDSPTHEREQPAIFVVTHERTRTDVPRTAPRSIEPQRHEQLVGPTVRPFVDVVTQNIPTVDVSTSDPATDAMELGRTARTGRGIPDGSLGSGSGVLSGAVLDEIEVDRAPHVLGAAPTPRYPEVLRGAGITGRVVVQFVVDTLGRAELGSVQVMDATRGEFAESVRAALPRFRFSPGEAGGRKVRTRVQIPFDFTLR